MCNPNRKINLSPEKLAIIAEKGMSQANLTKEEKAYLYENGLKDVYEMWDLMSMDMQPIPQNTITTTREMLINKERDNCSKTKQVFLGDIYINLKKTLTETIKISRGWQLHSPVFLSRTVENENEQDTISLHKEYGDISVNIQIVKEDNRYATVNIKLISKNNQNIDSFCLELIKDTRPIEIIDTSINELESLKFIEKDNYILRILKSQEEIALIRLCLE